MLGSCCSLLADWNTDVQAEAGAARPHCHHALSGVGQDRCVLHVRAVVPSTLIPIAHAGLSPISSDLGGESAVLEAKESIAGIIKVITSATLADSGKYLSYTGAEIPW